MRHEKEIRRWSKLQDGTSVWYKEDGKRWRITKVPNWRVDVIYIVDDEFAEVRKAFIDGEQLQHKVLWSDDCPLSWSREWCDYTPANSRIINGYYNGTTTLYRIKQPFKIGDWIKNRNFNTAFQANEEWIKQRPGGNTEKTGCDEDFAIWKPKEGDWVVYPIFCGLGAEIKYAIKRYEISMENYKDLSPLDAIDYLKRENDVG